MKTIEGDDDSYTLIDKLWTYKEWDNENGVTHRDGDLPATIYINGDIIYSKDGNIHRDGDLPAAIYANGIVSYFKYGEIHRDGGLPAIIRADGSVEYWVNGVKQK